MKEREREGEERWEKGRGDDDDEDLGADNSTTHNNQSNRLHRQEKKH